MWTIPQFSGMDIRETPLPSKSEKVKFVRVTSPFKLIEQLETETVVSLSREREDFSAVFKLPTLRTEDVMTSQREITL